MKSFASHLEGAIDGSRLDINKVQTLHKERPIWVRYDLDELKKEFKKEYLHERDSTICDIMKCCLSGRKKMLYHSERE